MASTVESLQTVLQVFRRECHRRLASERTTVTGSDGMLLVLQLVLAAVNKRETGEFDVDLSDVLLAWKSLLRDKLQIPDSPRPRNFDAIRQEYDDFLKRSNTVDLIDVWLMYQELKADSDPAEPLSSVQLLNFLLGGEVCSQMLSSSPCPQTPNNKPSRCRVQMKRALRRLFCSYLGLLVNTKDDLALAHAFNFPDRGLNQLAFTDLKHVAHGGSTSLFLAATSFVRAIQLAGKGYAPADSHPLRKHLKGLTEFVRFTDQLEEVLGDVPDPSAAAERLISIIRAALLKGCSSAADLSSAAEEVSRELKETITRISATQRGPAWSSGISPARPRAYAINHATAYSGRETVKVLKALLDEEALAAPCRNKAELLSGEQNVLEGAGGTCMVVLFRTPKAPTGSSPKPLSQRVRCQAKPKVTERRIRSQFACTYKDEEPPLSRVLQFSKCAPTEAKEASHASWVKNDAIPRVALGSLRGNACCGRGGTGGDVTKIQERKRKHVEGSGHEEGETKPPQKKPTVLGGSNPDKLVRRTAPNKKRTLIAGQAKLTNFFRL